MRFEGLDYAVHGRMTPGTSSWKAHIMNRRRTILVALITLAITPIAAADIYKCNGPDGPVYTDWKCGPDATNVELLDSSGLGGISDETKTQLAEKKRFEKNPVIVSKTPP